MALTAVVNGAFSDQLNVNQFINLFTGVMTDQPVTFAAPSFGQLTLAATGVGGNAALAFTADGVAPLQIFTSSAGGAQLWSFGNGTIFIGQNKAAINLGGKPPLGAPAFSVRGVTAADPVLQVQGTGGQSADLLQIRDAASNNRVIVESNGNLDLFSLPAPSNSQASSQALTFTSAYWNGGSVFETFYIMDGRQGGDPGAAGGHRLTIGTNANRDLNLFHIAGDGSSAVGIGATFISSAIGQLFVQPTAIGRVAVAIRAASGQTADLLQLQDNSSNALTKVTASGGASFSDNDGTYAQTTLNTSAAEFNINANSLITIGDTARGVANPQMTMYRTTAGFRNGTGFRQTLAGSVGPFKWQWGSNATNYGAETYTDVLSISTLGLLLVGAGYGGTNGGGLDTFASGPLSVGTTNTNSISVGRVGVLTTTNGPLKVNSGDFTLSAGRMFVPDGQHVYFGGANGSQSYNVGVLAAEPTRVFEVNARMAGADMQFRVYDGNFLFRAEATETTVASISQLGHVVLGDSTANSRDTLVLFSDAPRLYFGVHGSTNPMFKVSAQDTIGSALQFFSAPQTADPTAGTYTEIMRLSSGGTLSVLAAGIGVAAGQGLDALTAGDLWIGQNTATNIKVGKSTSNILFNASIAIPSGFSLDTQTVGQLNIGTINASPMNLGRTGISINALGPLTINGGGAYGAGANAVATTPYVQSRGLNLVTNGSGLLGNNYNFSSFTFDQIDTYSGAGSFSTTATQNTFFTDEYIPVDPSQTYLASCWAKAGDIGGGNFFAGNAQFWGIAPYDIDTNPITPELYSKFPGSTDTTLAAILHNGDTTMTLTSAAGWSNVASPLYQNNFTWWPYTNAKGYSYPNYTYSRNISNTYSNNGNNGTWTSGGISGNVITLRVPWAGPQLAAGTPVRNHTSGGTYKYIMISNGAVPNAWTFYPGFIGGIDVNGTQAQSQFPYGTAYVKMEFVLNNQGAQANTIRINNIAFGLQPTFFGHAPVTTQPTAPVTLADVIAIIRGSGLSA